MNDFHYGYRNVEGHLRRGASGPNGLFVPQVSELQPRGHWVGPDGTLTPEHGRPSRPARMLQACQGRQHVSYERRDQPIRVRPQHSAPSQGVGYRLVEGRLERGAFGAHGLFIGQVNELQPRGHWVEPAGLVPQHGPRSLRQVLQQLLGTATYVAYPPKVASAR